MSHNRSAYIRRVYCRRQANYLWGQKRIIKPVLLPIQFGDGRQLIALRPITTRTHHYVVAVNSVPDWFERGTPLLHDHLDAIYQEIKEQFGDVTAWHMGDEPERGECDPFKEWPAICLDIGCEWWGL